MAQMTYRLGFVLDGDGLSTPASWLVGRIEGRDFRMLNSDIAPFYIDVGPGEIIDLSYLEPQSWSVPNVISRALEHGEWHSDSPWRLVPRLIPAMVRKARESEPALVNGVTGQRRPFEPFHLAPGQPALLDFGELVCGYPSFCASGPGRLTATYAESLFRPDGSKGHRDEVAGKTVKGYQDVFVVPSQVVDSTPTLWWRTFRYIQLESNQPIQIHSFRVVETGYPYQVESTFEADDPWVERIWDVAVRTARRCAGETYFDCPYYEQLQYVGDTRIQALIHYYLSRDRRLARQALDHFEASILPDGLTQSRYPSRVVQVIPGFSLWWVIALLDQAQYDTGFEDRETWERRRTLADQILDAYGRLDHWPFLDWVDSWPLGIPPGGLRHPAALALLELAKLARAQFPGPPRRAEASLMAASVPPSEHAEALLRLLARETGQTADPWPSQPLADQCSLYFQFYKHLAMRPKDYMAELGPWKRMIEEGLTTFAETEDPTRSDCHAWSAHPILGFFQTVAGVVSSAPAWRRAKIEPRPGSIRRFLARIAHPDGDLTVELEQDRLTFDSPVPFRLVWKGKEASFEPGRHSVG
jgi:hypothetical protein